MEKLSSSSTVLVEDVVYDRKNPFYSRLVERYRLNKSGSNKETWHVVLDLSGSNIRYRPGDSIGICPENDKKVVSALLEVLHFSGDEEVKDVKTGTTFCVREYLAKKANLAMPTKKLLQELAQRGAHVLLNLLESDAREACRAFIQSKNVFELLFEHENISWQPQELIELFAPLLPRLYSISSAQECVGDSVHLTISRVRYDIEGKKRLGICSHYLCEMVDDIEQNIGVYVQSTRDFLLPEDHSVPIIMVGPGTGIAPFRAFMQNRHEQGKENTKNWLFFGEQTRAHDYFYEEYWAVLEAQGILRVDTAFSRDTKEKVYVQHKMWQQKKELWKWLQEGAMLYVCGDASKMAKDVDATLQEIACSEGGMALDEAKAYMASLRKQKRYLRDIY